MPTLTNGHEDAIFSSTSELSRTRTDEANAHNAQYGCEACRSLAEDVPINHHDGSDQAYPHA
jgi:hypothetical protein